jgi:hypothetical protein
MGYGQVSSWRVECSRKVFCARLQTLNEIGLGFLDETLWLRPVLRKQVERAARLIEKGVVCWSHVFRGLLLNRKYLALGTGLELPPSRRLVRH